VYHERASLLRNESVGIVGRFGRYFYSRYFIVILPTTWRRFLK